jgi:hypothetical protein
MTIGGHAYDATLAGGARHVHVHEPSGLKVIGISPDLPAQTVAGSMAFPYEIYTLDELELSSMGADIPARDIGLINVALPIPDPQALDTGLYDGVDPPVTPVFLPGLASGAIALSVVWGFLPQPWKTVILAVLVSAGASRGVYFAKSALLAGLRARGPVGVAVALFLTTVLADTFLPDVDIPFVPSFPLPGAGDGNGVLIPGAGGDPVDFAIAQHGPVVKSWVANGTPFYLFMDGWQAAQKRNGTWKFWKPKKPIVYVPGGPMSKRNARRLASIYNMEKKRAKKEFNLVDSRQGQGARVSKPTVIVETGPGSVNTR